MKSLVKNYRKTLPLVAFVVVAMTMTSCGGGGQRAAQERQLEEVKEETEMQIRMLRNDIEERIEYLEEELEEAEGELEEHLQEAKQELQAQLEILDEQSEAVREATLDSWEDVRLNLQQVYQKATQTRNEISDKVRRKLEGED